MTPSMPTRMSPADAVRREHGAAAGLRLSGPADLHVKSATAGDIDGDGDLALGQIRHFDPLQVNARPFRR